MPGWLTAKAVADNAEVKGVTEASIPLQSAAAAAETWVEGTARKDLAWASPEFVVPADVKLGGLMLAWRWYQRRASPLGVVTSPTGDPVEILRNDPDIARLLGVSDGSVDTTEGDFLFGAGFLGGVTEDGAEILWTAEGVPYLSGPA